MTTEQVNIAVADEYLGRFGEVLRRCRRAGLRVQQQLPAAGIISGAIDSLKIARLERIEGVAAVERSRVVQIAPPSYPVQ